MREPSVHPHSNDGHCSLVLQPPPPDDDEEDDDDDDEEDDELLLVALSPPPAVPVQPPWLNVEHAFGQCSLGG